MRRCRPAIDPEWAPCPAGPPEEDGALSGVDYHALARQHVLAEPSALVPAKRSPLAIRAASTIFQARAAALVRLGRWAALPAGLAPCQGPRVRRAQGRAQRGAAPPACRRPNCSRSPPAPPQYMVGLIVGAFQAVVVLFYQWVVDPAEHGTW